MGVVSLDPFLSLNSLARTLLERERAKKLSHEENYYRVARKAEYPMNQDLAVVTSDGQKRHRDLIQALEKLDNLGFRRNYHQMEMHKAYTVAALRWIYPDDLSANLVRLVNTLQIKELRSDVIVLTPRRYGKTMSVALWVAAYIMTQPEADVSIYSTGRRASKKLLGLIWKLCAKLYGSPDFCVAFNQEELQVKCLNGGFSKVGSFPSKEQVYSSSPLSF